MPINAGFMGSVQINTTPVTYLRVSDASVSMKQEVTTPDLVMGDYDRNSFYYGAISIDGSMSGPIDDAFGTGGWAWATARDTCGNMANQKEMKIFYFCDQSSGNNLLTVPNALANSISISATAGDIANFSIDVIGSGTTSVQPSYSTAASPTRTQTNKIITWDAMELTLTGHDGITLPSSLFSAFEMTVANNITPVYSFGSTASSLFPTNLITGLRQITGSVTMYNLGVGGTITNLDKWSTYNITPGEVQFKLGTTLTIKAKVKFHRINPSSSPGPITSTIGFTGIGHQTF